MIARLLHRSYVCRQAVELVTDYLEGRMSPATRRRFEAHLDDCPGCTEYLRQVRATIDVLGHAQPEDLPPDTLDGLVRLFREFHAGS